MPNFIHVCAFSIFKDGMPYYTPMKKQMWSNLLLGHTKIKGYKDFKYGRLLTSFLPKLHRHLLQRCDVQKRKSESLNVLNYAKSHLTTSSNFYKTAIPKNTYLKGQISLKFITSPEAASAGLHWV